MPDDNKSHKTLILGGIVLAVVFILLATEFEFSVREGIHKDTSHARAF